MPALRIPAIALAAVALMLGPPARAADEADPDHVRGEITAVEDGAIVVKARDGQSLRLELVEDTTILTLAKGSFTEVDFGVYVGSVAVKLEEYSPIIRDSAVWLHRGFELRLIDDQLRGIALGHKQWTLTKETIISHGWVDDIEDRVLSIKWGPSDYDETDVEIPRDAPVNRMSLADRGQIKRGAHVFAGARKAPDGKYVAVFVIVGRDGIVPPI